VVIPGLFNKLSAATGSATPRALLLPVLKRFWPALRAAEKRS